MATIIDDFSVGNWADIDTHASSDGQFTWSKVEGSGQALMRTNNSTDCQTVCAFGEKCLYRAQTDLGTDHYVQSILKSTNNSMYVGLAVRKDTSSTLTYYDVSLRMDADTVLVRKRVAGVLTILQTTAYTLALNTNYLVKLQVTGTTIRVYVAGIQVGSDLTDSSIAGGTRCGMVAEIGGNQSKTGNFASFQASDGAAGGSGRSLLQTSTLVESALAKGRLTA